MEPSTADGERRVMVEVRNANMSYGRKCVLRGFNMTVPERNMYAFLGPSGCGKTTLLSCLVGEKTLDSGRISLGVSYKDQIGYMPQDTALSASLTIGESVTFYGMLFGLSKADMKEKLAEIMETLDIPPLTSLIHNLSGGQQRRVSLCIALLHDPTLLILDEPTVGLDPLLSKRAWDYLDSLVKTKDKTVIITTHYVEEAKQADRVGMMRGGVLIVEGCPRSLMAEQDDGTLEAVFLRLSQKQEAESNFHNSGEDVRHVSADRKSSSDGQSPVKARQVFSPGHVAAHLRKNYYWLSHNKPMGVFIVALAALQILLFGLAFGREVKYLKFGIVNEDLENGVAVDCKKENTFNCSDPIHSSCWFMENVEKRKVVLVDFEDEDSAIEAAQKNEVWGYVRLKKNFSDAYMARQGLVLGTPPDVLERGLIDVRIDMSNQIIGFSLTRIMRNAYDDYAAAVYEACGWPVKASAIPIQYERPVHETPFPDFTSYGMPAMLNLCLFFMQMMICCAEVINEKMEGVLERNLISGLTYPETLLADSIYCMSFAVVNITTLLGIIHLGFGMHLEGSFPLLFSVCALSCVCGLTFGIFASTVTNNLIGVTFFGMGSLFAWVFMSGLFWPREGMHGVLRVVSRFLPITPAIHAVHAISFRGYGFSHPAVYAAFLKLPAWALFFLAATYLAIKKNILIQPKQT